MIDNYQLLQTLIAEKEYPLEESAKAATDRFELPEMPDDIEGQKRQLFILSNAMRRLEQQMHTIASDESKNRNTAAFDISLRKVFHAKLSKRVNELQKIVSDAEREGSKTIKTVKSERRSKNRSLLTSFLRAKQEKKDRKDARRVRKGAKIIRANNL